MAQKAIREYHAKNLLYNHLNIYKDHKDIEYRGVLVSEDNLDTFEQNIKFDGILVIKPDQLFGKRGKNGLIYKAREIKDAKDWITEHMNKEVVVKKDDNDPGTTGKLTHFIVEPYVEHTEEYYVAIKTERENDVIYFSEAGGIEIEENWDKVKEIKIPFTLENSDIGKVLKTELADQRPQIITFLNELYQVFKELNFTYLELNPFVISNHSIVPLDMVARVDTTAEYDMEEKWTINGEFIEFPKPFGAEQTEVEKKMERLDARTSCSLKLTILNPDGRVWLLTAGGGASVIFADTVADFGFADQLGNYGEYSGNPSTDETEAYCDLLFETMFKSTGTDKLLIIGGGIANFTDIAATFKGVIKSIEKNKEEFLNQNIKIYVRRAGPKYQEGLELIKNEVEKMGIPIEVNGPEMHMTRVVKMALT